MYLARRRINNENVFAGTTDHQLHNICSEDVGEPGELCSLLHCDAGPDDPDTRRAVHTAQHSTHLVPEL